MKNCFGRRYISHKDFLDYAKELDLFTDMPSQHLLEFLERHGILTPVVRVRFPPEIVRRMYKEMYPSANIPDPIEPDTDRLEAASSLYTEIFNNRWNDSYVHGEYVHALDEISSAHAPFIQTNFNPSAFVPWTDFNTVVHLSDGNKINDGGLYTRTCYHYWQVFPLAAFLRSGVTILYDLADTSLFHELRELRVADASRGKLFATLNLEARHELSKIIEKSALFDAVAWFEAYRQNAFHKHLRDFDDKTGKLPPSLARNYYKRCSELAHETLHRFALSAEAVLEFIKFQCELWCEAKRRSPEKVANEYARNIRSTVELYREVTDAGDAVIVERVGRAGGYFKPILRVIFPDWLEEQRELAERSLSSWVLPSMQTLPAPFTASEQDITDFCAWLEQQGLFQLYWHFKRLVDIGRSDHPIALAATASEVISYANTVELMVNAIIQARGQTPRGQTLRPKMLATLNTSAPALVPLLKDFKHLTHTNNSTLRRRIAQIDRIRRGGALSPVLRLLLKLIVIRNEGTHLGLAGFDRAGIYDLLKSLVQASIIIWKAR